MALSDTLPWQQALRALRDAGLSKQQIADAAGTSWRTVHRLERGEFANPHRAALVGIVRLAKDQGLLAA